MSSKSLFAWMFGGDEAASDDTINDAPLAPEPDAEADATAETDDTSEPEPDAGESEGTDAAPSEDGDTTDAQDLTDDDDASAETTAAESAADYSMTRAEVSRLGEMFGDTTAAAEALAAGMTFEQAVSGLAKGQANKIAALETDLADANTRLAEVAQGSPEAPLSGGTEGGSERGRAHRKDGLNENLGMFADSLEVTKK